jgi:hypothetical protein
MEMISQKFYKIKHVPIIILSYALLILNIYLYYCHYNLLQQQLAARPNHYTYAFFSVEAFQLFICCSIFAFWEIFTRDIFSWNIIVEYFVGDIT